MALTAAELRGKRPPARGTAALRGSLGPLSRGHQRDPHGARLRELPPTRAPCTPCGALLSPPRTVRARARALRRRFCATESCSEPPELVSPGSALGAPCPSGIPTSTCLLGVSPCMFRGRLPSPKSEFELVSFFLGHTLLRWLLITGKSVAPRMAQTAKSEVRLDWLQW